MSSLVLNYPVYTADNQLLLQADTELTQGTIAELVSRHKADPSRPFPILSYSSVKRDMLRFLGNVPYHAIFADQERRTEILSVMDEVVLPLPLLQSLEYFRENDFYTYRHVLVVFALSTLLSRRLLHDVDDQVKSVATSPFHDIGKVCVPLTVLKKTTPLTRCERKMLMHHTLAGHVLCCYYLGDPEHFISVVARDHHERRDGSGHPRGIPVSDRMVEIIAVCDIYDALISPRPYRPKSFDNRTALEEITALAEKNRIGWDVVQALVSVNRSRPLRREGTVSLEKRGTPPAENLYGRTLETDNDPCGD